MRIVGKFFSVWRARGPLFQRQVDAHHAGCVGYAEQHLNSVLNPSVNYSLAIVDDAAPGAARRWASAYTARVAREFGIRDGGVCVGGDRGPYNVRFTSCPAILLEPGFVSNPEFARIVQTGEGIDAVARCLVDTIRDAFPAGGLIGLSVGHAYRGKHDPGASVNQGELVDPATDSEAELNELIVTSAEEMLIAIEAPAP